MSQHAVRATAMCSAWTELCWQGYRRDVCLSCVQCVSAGPCFCSPNLHFNCYCLIYITQKRGGWREGAEYLISPLGLCSELPEFPESVSTLASLKTQQIAVASGFFFFCFSWLHKKGIGLWAWGTLYNETNQETTPVFLGSFQDRGASSVLIFQLRLGLKTDLAEHNCMGVASYLAGVLHCQSFSFLSPIC